MNTEDDVAVASCRERAAFNFSQPRICIGCHPGIAKTGIAAVEKTASGYRLLDAALIETPPIAPTGARLSHLEDRFIEFIEKTPPPDDIAVERCFFNRNVTNNQTTAAVIGIIQKVGWRQTKKESHVPTPQAVKCAIGVSPKATKNSSFLPENCYEIRAKPPNQKTEKGETKMTNNDETDKTLWQIHRNITLSGRNIERITAQYREEKLLDPPKIEAAKSHLNWARHLLREKIKPIQSEEDTEMTEEMTQENETLKTLENIHQDLGFAIRNLERIIAEWRNVKNLDPAKIKAVTIHLNRASYYLREKITSMLSEEERDW